MLCICAKAVMLWSRCPEGEPVTASAWLAGQAWLCCYADFSSLPEMRGHQLLSADYDSHGFEDRIVPLDVPFSLHRQSAVGRWLRGEWAVLRGKFQDTHLQLVLI